MSINKKSILILALLATSSIFIQAQNDDVGTGMKKQFFTGGNLGLTFGDETNIEFSPLFGYHISNIFSAGIGGSYQYYHSRYWATSINIFGGRVFMRLQPLKPFFIHGEYEVLTYKTNIFNPPTYEVENIVSENLLLGVGYREYISERFSSTIMLLYDFNYTFATPYSNPVFRFGLEWSFPAK